jgi:hypothetical protein
MVLTVAMPFPIVNASIAHMSTMVRGIANNQHLHNPYPSREASDKYKSIFMGRKDYVVLWLRRKNDSLCQKTNKIEKILN